MVLCQVKTRFQTPTLAGKYRSSFHAIETIIREEQLVGLYIPRLTSLALLNGVTFALYRFFVKLQLVNIDAIPTLGQVGPLFSCSILSISSSFSFIDAPTELIKIRHQDQLVLTSTRKIAMTIYEESYEGTCRYLSSYNGLRNPAWVIPLLAGGSNCWLGIHVPLRRGKNKDTRNRPKLYPPRYTPNGSVASDAKTTSFIVL
ncbi:hypothetical protein JOM56_007863 [Amanita muscaria]